MHAVIDPDPMRASRLSGSCQQGACSETVICKDILSLDDGHDGEFPGCMLQRHVLKNSGRRIWMMFEPWRPGSSYLWTSGILRWCHMKVD